MKESSVLIFVVIGITGDITVHTPFEEELKTDATVWDNLSRWSQMDGTIDLGLILPAPSIDIPREIPLYERPVCGVPVIGLKLWKKILWWLGFGFDLIVASGVCSTWYNLVCGPDGCCSYYWKHYFLDTNYQPIPTLTAKNTEIPTKKETKNTEIPALIETKNTEIHNLMETKNTEKEPESRMVLQVGPGGRSWSTLVRDVLVMIGRNARYKDTWRTIVEGRICRIPKYNAQLLRAVNGNSSLPVTRNLLIWAISQNLLNLVLFLMKKTTITSVLNLPLPTDIPCDMLYFLVTMDESSNISAFKFHSSIRKAIIFEDPYFIKLVHTPFIYQVYKCFLHENDILKKILLLVKNTQNEDKILTDLMERICNWGDIELAQFIIANGFSKIRDTAKWMECATRFPRNYEFVQLLAENGVPISEACVVNAWKLRELFYMDLFVARNQHVQYVWLLFAVILYGDTDWFQWIEKHGFFEHYRNKLALILHEVLAEKRDLHKQVAIYWRYKNLIHEGNNRSPKATVLINSFIIMIKENAALVHTRDYDGNTYLHYPLNLDMVSFLISHGLDIEAKNDHGYTPLQKVCNSRSSKKFVNGIKSLLAHSASLSPSNDKLPPLALAALLINRSILRCLLSNGASYWYAYDALVQKNESTVHLYHMTKEFIKEDSEYRFVIVVCWELVKLGRAEVREDSELGTMLKRIFRYAPPELVRRIIMMTGGIVM